jgi:hypothetical protein
MEFLNSDFFRIISILADVLTLISLSAAAIYGVINKNRTLLGFMIAKFLSGAFKISVLLFVLAVCFRFCEVFYMFPLVLFKGSSSSYYWQDDYEVHHLAAYFIFTVVFLTVSWIISTIIWTGSLNQTRLFLNLFLPKEKQLSLKQFKALSILSAKYGAEESYYDVTDKLKRMIEGNILVITASNDIAGDPIKDVRKKLILSYKYDGDEPRTVEILETKSKTIRPE